MYFAYCLLYSHILTYIDGLSVWTCCIKSTAVWRCSGFIILLSHTIYVLYIYVFAICEVWVFTIFIDILHLHMDRERKQRSQRGDDKVHSNHIVGLVPKKNIISIKT